MKRGGSRRADLKPTHKGLKEEVVEVWGGGVEGAHGGDEVMTARGF